MAASDIDSELLGVSIIVGNSYNIATKSTISSKLIQDERNAAIRRPLKSPINILSFGKECTENYTLDTLSLQIPLSGIFQGSGISVKRPRAKLLMFQSTLAAGGQLC